MGRTQSVHEPDEARSLVRRSHDRFNDPLAHIFDDSDHSMTESREIIIGVSQKQRLLLVCFAERRKAVRIISARKATKLERQDYEEARSS